MKWLQHFLRKGTSSKAYGAKCPSLKGFVAEADTIDAVIEIAQDLIPILLELVEFLNP